ncbi:MAG: amidohydrolase family protein [Frankia sp.]
MPFHEQSAIGIVDTLIGFAEDPDTLYASLRKNLRDSESREQYTMPAQYMFHDVPNQAPAEGVDAVGLTLREMDRHGISVGLVSLSSNQQVAEQALATYPDRFVASWTVDPNEGMVGIRKLVDAHDRFGVRAVAVYPHMQQPQIAVDAPLMYPVYAKCVELGLPVFVTVGIAGPRVPSMVQHVERIDQVMYDFPELVFVMRHGAEPWVDLAVKFMVKWPNLYYSTSAFSPRYYPKAIVEYANTRGADRILYAGYFPMGLTLDRIMGELADVPFTETVWPKFLRDNATRILRLDALTTAG